MNSPTVAENMTQPNAFEETSAQQTTPEYVALKIAHEKLQRQHRELKAANAVLHAKNAELQQFTDIASHDLHSPTRAILCFIEFLRDDCHQQLDATANEYIERIGESATRLQKLLKSLRSYSRIATDGSDFTAVDLNSVFDTARMQLGDRIDTTKAVVTRDKLPTVSGDHSQLSQLLVNLLGNSLTYRAEHPVRIHVSATGHEGEYSITVQDNGIGIAPEYYEKVFEPFRRLHTYSEIPGAGLGLAACRRIVERHGGAIGVQSQPGEGTSIEITLKPAE